MKSYPVIANLLFALLIALSLSLNSEVTGFVVVSQCFEITPNVDYVWHPSIKAKSDTQLHSNGGNSDGANTEESFPMNNVVGSDQLVLGASGILTSSVMLYSEFVLSQTGCGLPAGPFGLVGAVEGLSYLSVVGLVGYSIFQKVTSGSGLPAGKFGLLGLAEGLAFLAVLAGVVVLGLQVTNYGYIPNAVPMEGGMCK